jgi:GNAT superfamily N-acetyltransferase
MVIKSLEQRISYKQGNQNKKKKKSIASIGLDHKEAEGFFEFCDIEKNMLLAIAVYNKTSPSEIFITDFEVYNPKLRGQGIGTKCFEKLVEYLKKYEKVKKIKLKASKGYDESGIYKSAYDFWVGRCGFKETSEKSIVEYKL